MIDFPVEINDKIYTHDELINAIAKDFQEGSINEKWNLVKNTLRSFGLDENTMALADARTIDIIQKFHYLEYEPTRINNWVWMESYILLKTIKPRLI